MLSDAVTISRKLAAPPLYQGSFTITLQDVTKAITAFPEFEEMLKATTKRQWEWNPSSRTYRHEGKVIAPSEVYRTAEFIQQKAMEKIQQLSFIEGWQDKARQLIKEEYIRQYILGRGGLEQMTAVDWGRVGNALRNQYAYFNKMIDTEYSDPRRTNLLGLYVDSATQMFERARAATYAVAMPAYPGDGTTECFAHCACTWVYEREKGILVAYWTLGPVKTEHCGTCMDRSQLWSPYRIGRVA